MPRPTALLFDLDDTLVRDDEAVVAALFATCAGADCPTEELFLAVWQRAHSRWERSGSVGERGRALGVRPIEALMTETINGDAAFAQPLKDYREAVWTEAMVAVGSSGPGDAEQLTACLRGEALDRYRLLPGALDALAELRKDVPLALVTNGPLDLQRKKLRRLGLESTFEAIVISAEEGFAKPDAGIFLAALKRLGVEPAGAVMIGNDPVEDVEGALAAGLDAILLRAPGSGDEPAVEAPAIASVAQLPALLSRQANDRRFRSEPRRR
jgi:putative hydrolase of the HAD superfamily